MALMDSLLNLYRVDTQVRALRSRLDAAQRYLDAQVKQIEIIGRQREEATTRKKHLQATIANREAEIAGIDERIEKLRDELNNAVTNKQYNALLNELNGMKAERTKIEENVLGELELTEQLDAELGVLQSQLDEREKVRELASNQLHERQTDVGQRLAELQNERNQAAIGIPPDVLHLFDELGDMHEGEALTEVVEISRRHREYACGACNMQMPFNLISMLHNAADEIVRCPACGRILHIQDELRGSLSKK